MAVSENLKTAVDTKNLDDVRGSLWSCIIVDLNMTGKFKESFDYVLSHGISESELFVEDDGKEFETEPTRENFNNLSGLFSVNFSKKKYEALKKIGETLNPPKINSASRETSPSSGGTASQNRRRSTGSATNKTAVCAGGAAAGAVAGAVFGKVIFGSAAAIFGGVAVGAVAGFIAGVALSSKD